jgi:hypothetical protein
MSLMEKLLKAGGPTAECVGGRVIALVNGKKEVLGGPLGSTNAFEATAVGLDLLAAAKPAKAPRELAKAKTGTNDEPAKPGAPENDLDRLDFNAED